MARLFFEVVILQAKEAHLIWTEHFTVDGTLIDAWASFKSFRPKNEKDRPVDDDPSDPTVDFHGERRSNETHQSTTDPEAKLMRKSAGKEAKLCFSGHVLMENGNGLCLDISVAEANGTAERDEALGMIGRAHDRGINVRTVGADKAYDAAAFTGVLKSAGVTPRVAQNTTNRRSSIDRRTTRHRGYAVSQRCRKKVEEIFGWMKVIGGLRKTPYRGVPRTGLWAYLVATAYNLIRIVKLRPETAAG